MEGYAKLTDFMGQHRESALVLRFSDINLQNILYLQAEIYGLREDLRRIETCNHSSSSEDLKVFSLDWYALAQPQGNGETSQQWQKVKQLRMLLKDYNQAVLQFHQMSMMASPSPHDLHALQEWLRRPNLGAVYLVGRERDVWARGIDLMPLGERPSTNKFTSWITHYMVPIHHRAIGRRLKAGRSISQSSTNIAEYPDFGIAESANLVGSVLASVLPLVAIVILHLVKGTGTRLGLVGLFSAIFPTCLWFLTDGRLIEIFSATSAFAAVQVVFIGTNG